MAAADPDSRPRLEHSLRYPLRSGQAGWLAVFALGGVLVEAVDFWLPGILAFAVGLVLSVMLWALVYRVASEALLAAASGEDQRDTHRSDATDGLAVRHIGLWLIATLLVAAGAAQGSVTGTAIAALFCLLILPAATIALSLSKSLVDALVPAIWWRTASRIGWADYARLCGVLAGAAAAYLIVFRLGIRAGLPPGIVDIAVLVFWAASMLAWFHYCGSMVHAHRDALHWIPDADELEPEPEPERFTRDPDALYAEVMERGGSRAMHAELARALRRAGEGERRLAHGRVHVQALLHAFEEPIEALERAAALLELDPGFSLGTRKDDMAVLRTARDAGQPWLVEKWAANFLDHWPESRERHRVRVIACEALVHSSGKAHRRAEGWYRELMAADLSPELAERVRALAPHYLGRDSESRETECEG